MLKSIELSGFKSFADATRMEFSDGVSVLVGPNGSGKSNIVDAIRWVLGEQSVKKLRGGEMTDVIFNGSGSRQPVNFAEVTLSFDNTSNLFDVDSKELYLSRRIYRSGESEYLINRQPSRLKDFREILSGTGLGSQAYSIIEQGRVESLLQSSSVQRRTVFEEAAGIARFNAKKQEAARRLERVSQNLQRISDIVREVESQLRNTKNQAGKAQLYRQYTARLQELRTKVTLVGWHGNRKKIDQFQLDLDQYTAREKILNDRISVSERDLQEQNTQLEALDANLHQIEKELAAVRERMAAQDSTIRFQLAQTETFRRDFFDQGRQFLELNTKNGDAEGQIRQTNDDIAAARRQMREVSDNFDKSHESLEASEKGCLTVRAETQRLQTAIKDLNDQINGLARDMTGLDSRKKTLAASRGKLLKKLKESSDKYSLSKSEIDRIELVNSELTQKAAERKKRLDLASDAMNGRSVQLASVRKELAGMKLRQTGLGERISVLQDLLQKHEGISSGVREVLKKMNEPNGPFRHAHGLVADLIRVNVEAAPLIELALGQAAQYVAVSPDPELFRYIEENAQHFSGRVGFVWLDPAAVDPDLNRQVFFEEEPGVLGRADQFVETDPVYEFLVRRLLNHTWIVESLDYAKILYQKSDGRTNFLTVSGECLTAEGTLIVGPASGSSGLISRRSELRSLAEDQERIENEIAQRNKIIVRLEKELSGAEEILKEAQSDCQQTQAELDENHVKRSAVLERCQQMEANCRQDEDDFKELETELSELGITLDQTRQKKEELDLQQQKFKEDLLLAQADLDSREKDRNELSRQTTNLKIELAKCEERVKGLTDRKKQLEDSRHERHQLLKDHQKRYSKLSRQRSRAELTVLQTESDLAFLFARKEKIAARSFDLIGRRRHLNTAKNKIQNELKRNRQELNGIQNQKHSAELELERLNQEQKTLFDRMKEDFGIEFDEEKILTMLREAESEEKVSDSENSLNDSGDPSDERDGLTESIETGSASEVAPSNGLEDDSANELEVEEDECLQEEDQEIDPTEMLEEWQKEIEDLKSKLQRIGSVNLEALETLESLQTRYTTQFNQYNDLLTAHRDILKLIERINVNSQKLFQDTFDAVKIYFNDIFRKFFGGGRADIVLEDPEKPLESGIDIVVSPPGKELKSVSLLSGGEKTLTCVALLLAIFRYRVTPVCILDEVDAALDEGNVGRFAKVIQEFGETQFLIVTHSKKTMMAATSMYGVTMQDSGVSKLISVQFDDVGENGEIIFRRDSSKKNDSINNVA